MEMGWEWDVVIRLGVRKPPKRLVGPKSRLSCRFRRDTFCFELKHVFAKLYFEAMFGSNPQPKMTVGTVGSFHVFGENVI